MKPLTGSWIPQIRLMIDVYVDRLPGSFIEQKDYSLVWHYRAADQEMAPLLAKELIDNLIGLTANMDLQVLQGSKVVEIRHAGINKGTAALHWLAEVSHDFKMAIGDDWTDEDLFKVLLEHDAYTIKVGLPQSYARFYVRGQKDVLALLADMTA
jgi:trehalose 6-phosphate synthase/phosphatase